MRVFRTTLLAVALLFSPFSALASEWLDSLPDARQAAAEAGKDILILYVGDADPNNPDISPLPLFHSQHFAEAALPLGLVLVQQPAPVQKNEHGEEYRTTAVVFADATGRPYYCFQGEWKNGMDWVLEELKIAAERRPAIAQVWEEMESSPAGQPAHTWASPLLLNMPADIVLYHEPYAQLHAEAMEHDAHYREVRERREALADEEYRIASIFFSLLNTGGEVASRRLLAGDFGVPEEDLRALPTGGMRLYFLRDCFLLAIRGSQHNEQKKDDWQPMLDEMEKFLYRNMARAPRCKMARILRVTGFRQMQANLMAASLRGYRQDPQGALDALAAYMQEGEDSFFVQQYCGLMRARILAEMGQLDKAVEELRRAEQLDPVLSQAAVARQLRESIMANRARLEELMPLIRQGDAALIEEWNELLSLRLGLEIGLNSSEDHLFYESEEQAAATLNKVAEMEAADAASAEEAAFREELKSFIGELPSPEQEKDELLARAEQGDVEAQKSLCLLYMLGGTVTRDKAEAFKWLQRAGEQGDVESQLILALYYWHGMVVEKDEAAALMWLRRAAEQGMAEAQFRLAKCYLNGEGVEKDAALCVEWLNKAVSQDHAEAEALLGILCYSAEGVERDMAKALELLRRAARQGHARSQHILGVWYFNGEGVERDMLQAEYWLRKAAEQGLPEAVEALQKISGMFDPFAE